MQHEGDILNQKLTQELLTLKDDLKGMFDDRKMAVRGEQRTMESKVFPHFFIIESCALTTTDPRTKLQNHSRLKQR